MKKFSDINRESKFAMVKPCKTCPFIGGLASCTIERLHDFNLADGQTHTNESFCCHQYHETGKMMQCAGFLAFNKQNGVTTPYERKAIQMGLEYDIQPVDNLLSPEEFKERYK